MMMSCADASSSSSAAARLAAAIFVSPAMSLGASLLLGRRATWPDKKARRPGSGTLICEYPPDAISHNVGGLRRLTGADVRDGIRAVTLISKSKPESQLTPRAVRL